MPATYIPVSSFLPIACAPTAAGRPPPPSRHTTSGTCGSGCGAIDVWYDGVLYGTVSGGNVLNGGSQDDPYWITYSTGSCDSGDNGDVCNSDNGGQTGGTVTIAWLRIFT